MMIAAMAHAYKVCGKGILNLFFLSDINVCRGETMMIEVGSFFFRICLYCKYIMLYQETVNNSLLVGIQFSDSHSSH